MNRIKKTIVSLLILILAFLWIKEFTERGARQATDHFLGPALEQYEWQSNWFLPFYIDSMNDEWHWFRWQICYEYRFDLGDIDTVEVDWLGRIRRTSNKLFDDWLALPEDERVKKQIEWSAMERHEAFGKGEK